MQLSKDVTIVKPLMLNEICEPMKAREWIGRWGLAALQYQFRSNFTTVHPVMRKKPPKPFNGERVGARGSSGR